jgi:hypothetical protein
MMCLLASHVIVYGVHRASLAVPAGSANIPAMDPSSMEKVPGKGQTGSSLEVRASRSIWDRFLEYHEVRLDVPVRCLTQQPAMSGKDRGAKPDR